jgi:hypothetical protein
LQICRGWISGFPFSGRFSGVVANLLLSFKNATGALQVGALHFILQRGKCNVFVAKWVWDWKIATSKFLVGALVHIENQNSIYGICWVRFKKERTTASGVIIFNQSSQGR